MGGDAPAIVACRIDVTYGNRALRWAVDFGAGSGSIKVLIKLTDADGTVRYATSSEADLAIGMFGGDMAEIARKTIYAAVDEFGSRL